MGSGHNDPVRSQRINPFGVDIFVSEDIVTKLEMVEEGVNVRIRCEIPTVRSRPELENRAASRTEHDATAIRVFLVRRSTNFGMVAQVFVLRPQAGARGDKVRTFKQHPVIGVSHIGAGRHEQGDIGRWCLAGGDERKTVSRPGSERFGGEKDKMPLEDWPVQSTLL